MVFISIFFEDLRYEIFFLKLMRKCGKYYIKVGVGKMKTKKYLVNFFKCSLNFTGHALQSELNKVFISNFVKFQLQRISYKIE